MDFENDPNALNVNNEYMFGKSILVAPVVKPMYSKQIISNSDTTIIGDFTKTKTDDVYLPKGAGWIDFWTGEKYEGGQTVAKETPIDIIPLYVKSGAIIPFGPDVQYATEKKWDDLELRIYPGLDGKFTLYEDENDNYNYEKGNYSTINFSWNDSEQTLTIGERTGSFPGMLEERKFRIIKIAKGKGAGIQSVEKDYKEISYEGKKIVVEL
jgi:alpha-D-xyloside xylohydrolase